MKEQTNIHRQEKVPTQVRAPFGGAPALSFSIPPPEEEAPKPRPKSKTEAPAESPLEK